MEILTKNLDYLILAVGIVFTWRGVWGLSDLYIFPEIPTLSFITSLIVGIIILFIHSFKDKDIKELVK